MWPIEGQQVPEGPPRFCWHEEGGWLVPFFFGTGFAGQYVVIIRRDALKGERGHQVTVVSPYLKFIDVPSPAWAGIGQVKPEAARFEQGPVHDRLGYDYLS